MNEHNDEERRYGEQKENCVVQDSLRESNPLNHWMLLDIVADVDDIDDAIRETCQSDINTKVKVGPQEFSLDEALDEAC
jgi:hypothetical protein